MLGTKSSATHAALDCDALKHHEALGTTLPWRVGDSLPVFRELEHYEVLGTQFPVGLPALGGSCNEQEHPEVLGTDAYVHTQWERHEALGTQRSASTKDKSALQ